MALSELLDYSEKLLQRLKLINSIVETFLNYLFEKCLYPEKFYYCPNPSLNINHNTHIAAIASYH